MTIEKALQELASEADPSVRDAIHQRLACPGNSPQELHQFLANALIANASRLSPTLCSTCEQFINSPAHVVSLQDLETSGRWWNVDTTSPTANKRVCVYRGDLTELCVDAVVNAANDSGTGCYQPTHRCIDNVLHRAAGPSLRRACQTEMQSRNSPLSAGTPPIITPGFLLPAKHVLHVTGPQCSDRRPTENQRAQLEMAYLYCLDLASAKNLSSVAFPCISTGLFGYPQQDAADVAVRAVCQWYQRNPESSVDVVVFDTFTPTDHKLYLSVCKQSPALHEAQSSPVQPFGDIEDEILAAAKWLGEADMVLVCAGAGMSAYPPEKHRNVYVTPSDFARHYPDMPSRGYHTAYECIGLGSDPSLSQGVKSGFLIRHMNNMRWAFPPNAGYATLLRLCEDKDTFVLTSNVDGCFVRSGFNPERVYTPQGEWTYYQCCTPCSSLSVYESREMLDSLLPLVDPTTGALPDDAVPKCRRCGGRVFGNVRGGDWFIHQPYQAVQERFVTWLSDGLASEKKLLILEIGAGMNTPTVTRFPMEQIVRESRGKAALVRINPSDHHVPRDLSHACSLAQGWQALQNILDVHLQAVQADTTHIHGIGAVMEQAEVRVLSQRASAKGIGASRYDHYSQTIGEELGWRGMIEQLS